MEEESCSSCNFLLVEQETNLKRNPSELSASFEEKMPPLGMNVEDFGDEDDVQLSGWQTDGCYLRIMWFYHVRHNPRRCSP